MHVLKQHPSQFVRTGNSHRGAGHHPRTALTGKTPDVTEASVDNRKGKNNVCRHGGRERRAKKHLGVGAKQELALGAASLMYLKQQGASVKYFAYASTLEKKVLETMAVLPSRYRSCNGNLRVGERSYQCVHIVQLQQKPRKDLKHKAKSLSHHFSSVLAMS